MAELAQIALGALALLFAFLAGRLARNDGSVFVQLFKERPGAFIQLDKRMSDAELLEFLELIKKAVDSGNLLPSERFERESANDGRGNGAGQPGRPSHD